MQVCTLLQTDNHAPTTQFFTGRMPFLPPNQQHQGTEGTLLHLMYIIIPHNAPGLSNLAQPVRHVASHYHERVLQLSIHLRRQLATDELLLTKYSTTGRLL